jgi:hypothetical protein
MFWSSVQILAYILVVYIPGMHKQVQGAAYFIEDFSIEKTKSQSKIFSLINIHAGKFQANIFRVVPPKRRKHPSHLHDLPDASANRKQVVLRHVAGPFQQIVKTRQQRSAFLSGGGAFPSPSCATCPAQGERRPSPFHTQEGAANSQQSTYLDAQRRASSLILARKSQKHWGAGVTMVQRRISHSSTKALLICVSMASSCKR